MKALKKSMFLSTILMVVLLIVALSTATFAWFTASSTVQTNTSTIAAATSSSANLTLSWSDTLAGQSTISLISGAGQAADKWDPMVPKTSPSNVLVPAVADDEGTNDIDETAAEIPITTLAAFSTSGAFNTQYIKFNNPTIPQFIADGTNTAPWVINSIDSGASVLNSAIYVHNKNTNAAANNVTISATISRHGTTIDASDALRIAVFVVPYTDANNDGVFEATEAGTSAYVGTLAKNAAANVRYGAITENAYTRASVSTEVGEGKAFAEAVASPLNDYAAVTSINLGNIPVDGVLGVQIAVWYDGAVLDSTIAGGFADFVLNFNMVGGV